MLTSASSTMIDECEWLLAGPASGLSCSCHRCSEPFLPPVANRRPPGLTACTAQPTFLHANVPPVSCARMNVE